MADSQGGEKPDKTPELKRPARNVNSDHGKPLPAGKSKTRVHYTHALPRRGSRKGY